MVVTLEEIFNSNLLPKINILSIYKRSFVTVSQNSEITQFGITIATNCRALHECKLCSRSGMSEQSFVSLEPDNLLGNKQEYINCDLKLHWEMYLRRRPI
jgi:hypothetical protein